MKFNKTKGTSRPEESFEVRCKNFYVPEKNCTHEAERISTKDDRKYSNNIPWEHKNMFKQNNANVD